MMDLTVWFKQLTDKYKDDPEYILEGLLIDLNEQIVKEMEAKGITRTQLAKRLNCSNAYITKLLNGNENITLKKLLEVALALGHEVDIALKPRYARVERSYHYAKRRINGKTSVASVQKRKKVWLSRTAVSLK